MNQNKKFKHDSIVAYERAIADANVSVERFEKEQRDLNLDLEIATKKLRDQLEAIEKPIEVKIELSRKQESHWSNLKYELCKERDAFENHLKAQKAFKVGEFTEETVQAYLEGIDALGGRYGHGDVDLKKKLKNGVTVYREYSEDEFRKYFLFKGTTLIGFWKKRTPEHPGDETQSECWVNVKKMTHENELAYKLAHELGIHDGRISWSKQRELKPKHPFWKVRTRYGNYNATIHQFMNYVEALAEFTPIEVSDDNVETMKEVY